MTTTVTETAHVWPGQPPYFHCVCDQCPRTMSFRRQETADRWAAKHDRDHTMPSIRDDVDRVGGLLQREVERR